MKKSVAVWGIIALVLLIDQWLKIWIKTHLEYGDEFNILGFSWARIHFVENNGMAFGINPPGEYGKLALSLFRILAVGFLVYYLRVLLRSGAAFGLLISFSLILAGAIGNIIDSAFYGMIFSGSIHGGEVAQLFPEGGGYSSFLHGMVVDMLYFPLVEGFYPDWFPFWGGQHYQFFKPVFNIADSSITVGVLYILVFQRSFFKHKHPDEETTPGQETLQPKHTDDSLGNDTTLEGEAAGDEAAANDAGKDQA